MKQSILLILILLQTFLGFSQIIDHLSDIRDKKETEKYKANKVKLIRTRSEMINREGKKENIAVFFDRDTYYNEDGSAKSVMSLNFWPIQDITTYKYDSIGKITESIEGQTKKKIKYQYDLKGRIIKESYYNSKSQLTGYKITNYDSDTSMVELHYKKRKLISKYESVFDFDKSKYTTKVYYPKNELLSESEYDLNENLQILKETVKYEDTLNISYFEINKYDDSDKRIECERFDLEGNRTSKTIFKYNEKGLKIESREVYDSGNTKELIIRYEYEFYE